MNTMIPRQKILIIGGGIAGITLAHFLSNSKYEITLIEKGRSWRTIGYAIGIWKVGIDILKKLPLTDAFWSQTYKIDQGGFLNNKRKVLVKLNFAKTTLDGFGAITVERDVLHSSIVKTLPKDIFIRFNTVVETVESTFEKTKVSFNDGSSEIYDLVVIADGMRSSTRKMVFGECLHSYGWKMYGDWSKKENAIFPGNHIMSAPGQFLINIPGHDRCAIGLICHCKNKCLIKTPQTIEEIADQFSKLLPSLNSTISNITEPTKMFIDEMVYVKTKEWYRNRVVLIGDAQHGMSPVSGWGTSLALEDAYFLAATLNANSNIDESLHNFVKNRKKILKRVKRFCRTIEYLTFANTKTLIFLRNTFLQIFPNLPQRLFSYAIRRDNI